MCQTTLLSPSVSLPPLTYKNVPVVTTEMLASAYGCSAKNIRDNFRNHRERFVEGKHYYALSGSVLRDFRVCADKIGADIPPHTRNLIVWLERGAARHAKMLNTDQAWDVFELLEETFFHFNTPSLPAVELLPLPNPAAPITPEQQATLQGMVRALVAKGCGYAQIWSRFNNHFRIGKYSQLPQGRMGEAVEYLMAMEVKSKALPAPEPSYEEKVEAVRQRMQKVYTEFYEAAWDLTGILRDPYWGKNVPEHAREFGNAMNYGIQALAMTVQQGAHALDLYCRAHVEGLKCLRA